MQWWGLQGELGQGRRRRLAARNVLSDRVAKAARSEKVAEALLAFLYRRVRRAREATSAATDRREPDPT